MTIYDISYLLLAKEQGIPFVTADRRFHTAASEIFYLFKFFNASRSFSDASVR